MTAEDVGDGDASLAPDDVQWTSIHSKPGVFPIGIWGMRLDDGTLIIKDTVLKGPYPNRLVKNNTFEYYLPPNDKGNGGKAKEIKEAFFKETAIVDAGKRHKVRVFSMTEAADHYLGEWVVHSIKVVGSPLVSLRRLAAQSPEIRNAYAIKTSDRSLSESRHRPVIRTFFEDLVGGPILLVHEPSAVCDLKAPYVQNGRCTAFSSDSYTIDFAVSNLAGTVSFGIESKWRLEDALRPTAVEKCLYYRDKNLRRTVIFAGHDQALRVVDLGTPGTVIGGPGGASGPPPGVYTLEEAKEKMRI